MSKLDGNERWKSKMLLTEHAEQYEQAQITERRIMTSEERLMVRDYILLPHMETMVQRSLSDIEHSTNILKRLYLTVGHKVLTMITDDKYKLGSELRKRNIKVGNEEQEDLVVYYLCYCRGYEERFGMTREVMRSEISLKLTKYTADLITQLKGK